MKDIETLRKELPFVRQFAPGMYCTELQLKSGKRGSVCFGPNEGPGWEHVSFAPFSGKTPSWDDMCELKDLFFLDEEEVYQIHPAKSRYINLKDNCLHLWRHKDINLPTF